MDFLLQHSRFTDFFCKQLLCGDGALQNAVTGFFVCLLFNLKQSLSPQPLPPTVCQGPAARVQWSGAQPKARNGNLWQGKLASHRLDLLWMENIPILWELLSCWGFLLLFQPAALEEGTIPQPS